MIDKSIQSLTRTAPPGASVSSTCYQERLDARHTRTSIIRLPGTLRRDRYLSNRHLLISCNNENSCNHPGCINIAQGYPVVRLSSPVSCDRCSPILRSETSWKSRKKKEFDHDLLIFEFRYLNEGVRRRVLNTRNGVYWMFIICKVIRRGIESRNKIFIDFQSNRIIGRNSAKLLQGGILVKSNTIFRSIFFRHSPFPREC